MSQEESERDQLSQIMHEARRTLFDRDITPQEFYALLCRYPYLEVRKTETAMPAPGVPPTIITAKNGWKIYDYGDFMVSGCYELIAQLWVLNDSENGGGDEGGEGGGGYGTIVQQTADVVQQMLALALQKGWPTSEIVSGHYPLQRLYWILASLSNHEVSNFERTLEDFVVWRWIKALREKEFVMPKYPYPQGR